MKAINDEYCNLQIKINQKEYDSNVVDDLEITTLELNCQLKKDNHKGGFHLDSLQFEKDDETTIVHIQWVTKKTEELI